MTRTLLSIGDFAHVAGLSVSAVRFYADRGLLTPAEVDPSTGYRRFLPSQIEIGELIRDCRRMKMSLEQIAAILTADVEERSLLATQHVSQLERHVDDVRELLPSFGNRSQHPTTIGVEMLSHGLRHVLSAAGRDPERPDFMVVRVEVRDCSLRLAATDRYRLAVRDIVPNSLGAPFTTTLAAATVHQWQTSLRTNADTVRLMRTATGLTVDIGEIQTEYPEVAVNFPAYDQVLQPTTSPSGVAMVDRDQLEAAIEKVDVVEVVLSSKPGAVDIVGGSCTTMVAATITGSISPVVVSADFALDAVRNSSPGEIMIEWRSDTEAIQFRGVDDGMTVTAVMPILGTA